MPEWRMFPPAPDAAGTAIPCLPCVSLDETLPFWQLLGFEVTYRQKAPNAYAVIRRDGYQLHFFGMPGLEPTAAFSTCLVLVPEVEGLHGTFAANLREALGRVPMTGLPRLSRMRPGQTRFTVTDPNGNAVIFIKAGDKDEEAAQAYMKPGLTRLQRALHAAARLRDYKLDDVAAAKVLDVALGRDEPASPVDRVRALAARAELALVLGEVERARDLHAEIRRADLSVEERENLREVLEAAGTAE